ncbi:MAG TPA: glycosyltransferase [Solirubrobacteraceae bacterium]|nr:glycosyltransferase [Solirubrobacteraceae bacterium]
MSSQEREELEQRDHDLAQMQRAIVRREHALEELRQRIAALEGDLALARQAARRTEESVTWQLFQKVRARLYRAVGGERSLGARALARSLRLVGRYLRERSPAEPPSSPGPGVPSIELPEYSDPQVSLIIPVHSHAALTEACLYSIADHTTHARYEVILVDDTADADTKRMLAGVAGATILRNESNLGFLRSMNRGASVARGDWLVLFNNDTEVTRGWLSAMLECATSAPDVGVVTPKFIYPDGTLNEAGGIVWRDGTAMNFGRCDLPSHFQYEYRRETDYGSAAALMVSAKLWKDVGGFDERYVPIYYEDTDLCFQARERGLRVLYEPEAVVVHVEGATSGTNPTSGAKRYQELNREKFVDKWTARLAEQWQSSPMNVRLAANRFRGQQVLVMDHRVPMADRDSGSLRMLSIMRSLIRLGVHITFIPENLAQIKPYTRTLQRMGIEVLYGGVDVRTELAMIGPRLTAAILCRPHTSSHWLDTVREFAPQATILYDTVDLHWLREARRFGPAHMSGTLVDTNGSLDTHSIPPKAKILRDLELALIRNTDATLVVTDDERAQIQRDVPNANVFVVPNIHDIEPEVAPAQDRSGILFIGSFEHLPNVDAAVQLVKHVMPVVWESLGNLRVTIVGSDPPPEVQALASSRVDVTGWVRDLRALLGQSRMLVAPLRYGAGMKGKITQCLAAGLPVVTTSIGAEGLIKPHPAGDNGEYSHQPPYLLTADHPSELAREVVRLQEDDDLWERLSVGGQQFVAQHCSTEIVSRRIGELLGSISRPSISREPDRLVR